MPNQNETIEENDNLSLTKKYMSIADTAPNTYEFIQGTILTSSPVQPKDFYSEAMTKSEINPELIQILRYLYRMTYADFGMILKQAELCRREGAFQNIVIDAGYLKKQVDKLVHLGLVNRRTFVDEQEYRKVTNSGQNPRANWSSNDKITCYCLTDRGAGFFKRQTEATGFIEECVFELPAVEVSRRLTCNAVTTYFAKTFMGLGEIHYCEPTRFGKYKRDMLYGCFITEDKKQAVVFEPIMQYRDILIQSAEELKQHFEERGYFIRNIIDSLKEKYEDINVALCLVFSKGGEIRYAIENFYFDVCEKYYLKDVKEVNTLLENNVPFDELLAVSEPLVRHFRDNTSAPATFFRLMLKLKDDGTIRITPRQAFPLFLRRPE